MSTHSLFPDGVEVHQSDLTRESNARVADTLSRHLNTSEMGVVAGLIVTVNSGSTSLIDVSSGAGYAINGEIITVPVSQTAITLADTVANHVNLVVLFYTEIQSLPEAHEDLGKTFNTASTASFRLVVMTPSAYAALPATNADLTVNTLDRSLVVAQVTATGGALTSNNITNSTIWSATLAIARQPVNITGIFIDSISPSTNIGNGTLAFTIGSPGTISWAAPGDSPGTPIPIPVDGVYTITSANTAFSIIINAVFVGLPAASTSDLITITSLYSQTVSSFSASDQHHRHLIGSGVPTPQNPHGLTINDIGGGNNFSIKDHQAHMHASGIEPVSDPSFLSTTIINSTPNSLSVVTASLSGGINVNGLVVSATSTQPLPLSPFIVGFADVTDLTQALYEIVVKFDSSVTKNKRLLFPPSSTLQSFFKIIDISDDTGAGARILSYNTSLHTLSYDGGPVYTLNTVLTGQIIRMVSSDRKTFIKIWYNGTSLPGSNVSETLTTFATSATSAIFGMVTFSGAGGGLGAGILGYGPSFQMVDRRVYGNIDTINVTSRLLEDVVVRQRRLQYPEQVVLDGFDTSSAGGLSVAISAGRLLRDGVDTYVSGLTTTVPASTTTFIYIDESGTVQKIDSGSVGGIFGLNTKAFKIAKVVSGSSSVAITDYRHLISTRVTNLISWVVGSNGDVWGTLEAAVALSPSSWVFDTSGNLVSILGTNQSIQSNGIHALNILSGASCGWDALGTITIGGVSASGITIGRSGVGATFPGGMIGNLTGNVSGNVTGTLTGNVVGNLTGNITGNVSGSSGSCTGNAATATLAANSPAGYGRLPAATGSAFLVLNGVTTTPTSTSSGGNYVVTISGMTAGSIVVANAIGAGNFIITGCTPSTNTLTINVRDTGGGGTSAQINFIIMAL